MDTDLNVGEMQPTYMSESTFGSSLQAENNISESDFDVSYYHDLQYGNPSDVTPLFETSSFEADIINRELMRATEDYQTGDPLLLPEHHDFGFGIINYCSPDGVNITDEEPHDHEADIIYMEQMKIQEDNQAGDHLLFPELHDFGSINYCSADGANVADEEPYSYPLEHSFGNPDNEDIMMIPNDDEESKMLSSRMQSEELRERKESLELKLDDFKENARVYVLLSATLARVEEEQNHRVSGKRRAEELEDDVAKRAKLDLDIQLESRIATSIDVETSDSDQLENWLYSGNISGDFGTPSSF